MVSSPIYTITETSSDAGNLCVKIQLDASHKIYSGHFPGFPVTPGVMQLQIVKEILEGFHKKDLRLVSITRCKFLKMIDPVKTPNLTINISGHENLQSVTATGSSGEDVFFKLSATYANEP